MDLEDAVVNIAPVGTRPITRLAILYDDLDDLAVEKYNYSSSTHSLLLEYVNTKSV